MPGKTPASSPSISMENPNDRVPSGTENGSGFRLDIQGIRAIAIGLVLLAHSQVSGFAGGFIGIDVFFVLSGFLITGLVVKEIETTGRFSIRDFYARRARRLLPLAALVLGFIAIGSLALFAMSERIEVGKQIVGAALYFVNWIFAAQHVDYFHTASGFISPIQHYWSLSVEEQFYLVWPLVMLAASLFAVRTGRRVRPVLLAVLIPIALLSFAYSIHLTATNPETAYFSTLTRLWELASGAVLAIVLPRSLNLRPWPANLLVGLGMLVILFSALTFDESSSFPGWLALFPVLGTISILVGGSSVHRGPMVGMLCLKPVQYVGRISYSWYLWHWPCIVFAMTIWPEIQPGWLAIVTLASLIPAQISHVLVEDPIRKSGKLRLWPKRALAIGAVCSVTAASVGVAMASEDLDVNVVNARNVAGAMVVKTPGQVPIQQSASRISPDPLEAGDDRARLFADGCLAWGDETTQPACTYGATNGDVTAVLFGDSRAMSYFPAIEPIAKERGWKLVGLTRGNCTPALVDSDRYCNSWRINMLERMRTVEQPDLVIIGSATKGSYAVQQDGKRLGRGESESRLVDGMVRTIRILKARGAKVIVIRDQTMAPFVPADCVASNLRRLNKCVYPPANRKPRAFELAAARKTGVRTIDPQRLFCSRTVCPAVIGDTIVNHDRYHVSETFAETMTPWFRTQLPQIKPAGKQ